MKLYAQLTKVEPQSDGTLKIYGVASTESVDSAGEVVKAEAIRTALPEFFRYGTGALREMHQLSAAGVVEKAEVDDDNITNIVATVVDDAAIKKCTAGVYKGLSIGGKVLARDKKAANVITEIALSEISLVDRPCNPDATFQLWKAETIDDGTEPGRDTKIAPDTAPRRKAKGKSVVDPEPVTDLVEKTEPTEPTLGSEAPADPALKATAAVEALEALAVADLGKSGMWSVSEFSELLSSISYLIMDAAWESEIEGDASPIPEQLRGWLEAGAKIFQAMAAEEVSELVAMAAAKKTVATGAIATPGTEDVQKAAAEALAKASDDLARKTEEADGLVKRLAEREAQLVAFGERVEKSVAAISERLAKVEAEPVPPKTAGPAAAALGLTKGADASGVEAADKTIVPLSEDDVRKALDAMSDEERALVLIKAAYRFPTQIQR